MGPVAISFGIATAAVVGAGFLVFRRDHGLAAAASVVLALGWASGQISERLIGWEMTPDIYAIIDITSALAVALLYARTEARWIIALAVVIAMQSGMHLIYQADLRVPGGIYSYILGLNALYAASLILVAYGGRGAADVLADIGRRCLRRLSGRHLQGGAQAAREHGIDL